MIYEQQYVEHLRPLLQAHSVSSYLADMRAVENIVGEITPDMLHSEQDVQEILLRLQERMPPERVRNCGSAMRRYVEVVEKLSQSIAINSLETEMITHGIVDPTFVSDREGRESIRVHVEYERSIRNRAEAIRIHGAQCKACGFDFNVNYGEAHARDFIEVHHVRSIAEQGDQPIEPLVDLVTLCSNCHSMAHRENGRILSVGELKELIASARPTSR